MELKDYQHDVLNDLSTYLQTLLDEQGHLTQAFCHYWENKGVKDQQYHNNIPGVPQVCVKVPTAGGKTFIAVHALARIFSAFAEYHPHRPKFVVWLVPSLTILEQTVSNLSQVDHPYRQSLNALFNGQVQIYEKAQVLLGAGFNADTVQRQLSIVVMSFDSLKTNNKENRKAFQENAYLASFSPVDQSEDENSSAFSSLPNTDPSALINVLRRLNPVVVVDESHNAGSVLSQDMLANLNPSFIFDLTATPREKSNIISYVDALRLKKQNMVKLPVIVANQVSQDEVILSALTLRRQLEALAQEEEAQRGGSYIRPIVLFQAEPQNKDDTTTFTRVKELLLDLKIPAEQIAIKTATVNELKHVDLLSRDCQIRYLITVNALKEGWDCPFAYILATLANRSSVIDVTQILGRVLRMPYARQQSNDLLNLSYVFTASNQFQTTLNQVVLGLNKAGFSQKDYKEIDLSDLDATEETDNQNNKKIIDQTQRELDLQVSHELGNASTTIDQIKPEQTNVNININPNELNAAWQNQAGSNAAIKQLTQHALNTNAAFVAEAAAATGSGITDELKPYMNEHQMTARFAEQAAALCLPQFFIEVTENQGFFDTGKEWQRMDKANLLVEFKLANLDANIRFAAVESAIYTVDVEEIDIGNSTAYFRAAKKAEKTRFNTIIHQQSPEGQIVSIVARLLSLLGRNAFYPIDDMDVKHYLTRIVAAMTPEQCLDCLDNEHRYAKLIKQKIDSLATEYARHAFQRGLMTAKIRLQASFSFPSRITPKENAPALSKSLYAAEGGVNPFEAKVIRQVVALDNMVWWHRNLGRSKGFVINGFINHYPDFILLTQKNNVLILETKGDDRDNSDSKAKLELGMLWANHANQLSQQTGFRYHYIMVFDNNPLPGAFALGEALQLLQEL